jgi:hypothetical protein
MAPAFVLAHSPLVGPRTWSLVADQLRQRGVEAIVPALVDGDTVGLPYWRQEADSAARVMAHVPRDRRFVLVGHSGAGLLLPAIRAAIGRPAVAYIFVDAGLPHDDATRLDEMRTSAPEIAEQLRQHLAAGGRFPEWSDEDLREGIPDPRLRRATLEELRPRSLAFFIEPIPAFAGWPDAPCGYLQLSAAYEHPAEDARRRGWPCRRLDAGHFHMLVDPAEVSGILLDLVAALVAEV